MKTKILSDFRIFISVPLTSKKHQHKQTLEADANKIYKTLNWVLGQLPPRKLSPDPKTNPKPNPNPNQGAIFLEGNCLVAPQP